MNGIVLLKYYEGIPFGFDAVDWNADFVWQKCGNEFTFVVAIIIDWQKKMGYIINVRWKNVTWDLQFAEND